MIDIGGVLWRLVFVPPASAYLVKYDGSRTIGMTDLRTSTVYVADNISGVLLRRVLIHEFTHCVCFAYSVYLTVEQEERLCEFLAYFGDEIVDKVDAVLDRLRTSAV